MSLRGWIEEANSEWDMPAQLAIQMHAQSVYDAYNVIEEMLELGRTHVDWVRRVEHPVFHCTMPSFFVPPLRASSACYIRNPE